MKTPNAGGCVSDGVRVIASAPTSASTSANTEFSAKCDMWRTKEG